VREHVSETLAVSLDAFDVIQVGIWTTDSSNRFLAEYATR